MTLPNKLTVTRLCLAPVLFIWYYMIEICPKMSAVLYAVILTLLYAVMELTDLLDGQIARRRNLVTDLGKVMDPFGDVICHLTFFTCFLSSSMMPVAAFVLILWREFSQSFLRMLLMGKGKPMAANIFGKLKTCFYALCSILGFALRVLIVLGAASDWMPVCLCVMFYLAAFFSVVSFLIYIENVRKQGVLSSMTR